ncbi:hypothetical protein EG68_08303 [Paragonimus skrjabini miyazakii]|uniref:Uncharacterized protein n=1 Tax=Paragonimus skrjabini miyazakii TaxID=59628 RepID=A0A8S9YW52_9TREM|nr:hypothetical protein EG68_08303 [Paragonimus skrjabini miyazakii]
MMTSIPRFGVSAKFRGKDAEDNSVQRSNGRHVPNGGLRDDIGRSDSTHTTPIPVTSRTKDTNTPRQNAFPKIAQLDLLYNTPESEHQSFLLGEDNLTHRQKVFRSIPASAKRQTRKINRDE